MDILELLSYGFVGLLGGFINDLYHRHMKNKAKKRDSAVRPATDTVRPNAEPTSR